MECWFRDSTKINARRFNFECALGGADSLLDAFNQLYQLSQDGGRVSRGSGRVVSLFGELCVWLLYGVVVSQ